MPITSKIVTTEHIVDGAVTEPKLGSGAVTETKIADDSIDTPKLKANSITTEKLYALAVTAAKIAVGAIIAEKIGAGAVTTEKLDALAVTAEKVSVATLSAIQANLGEVTAGIITGLIIRTALSGARIYMDTDNLIAYDAAEDEIFRIIISGTDMGDVIIGNYAENKGVKWDASEDTFSIRGFLDASDFISGILSGIGIILENRTDDIGCTETGRIWFRTDI